MRSHLDDALDLDGARAGRGDRRLDALEHRREVGHRLLALLRVRLENVECEPSGSDGERAAVGGG